MSEAADIYQAYLDDASNLYWSRDFAKLAQAWVYPHVIRARHLSQVMESPQDVIDVAEIAHRSMKRLGATAFHRICIEAEFEGPNRDRIRGTHRNYVLNGGSYAHPPYEARILLLHVDGRWRGADLASDHDVSKITTLDVVRSVRVQ